MIIPEFLSENPPALFAPRARENGWERLKMPRKKRCPKCGSKKVVKKGRKWKCETCGHTWSGKIKKSRSKKNKVRF